MPLSTSRQQFLAYETHGDPDIQYGRKGGIFISTCICIGFIIFAALIAILVGIIVYYITYFRVAENSTDFWDKNDPFGHTSNNPDLRLPQHVVPSFYRLKIKADLESSTFNGDVYITIRANKKVKEIILHAKDLSINENVTLIEQIYENDETTRQKREINSTNESTTTEINSETITDTTVNTQTNPLPVTTTTVPIDTQVTHSHVRNVNITSIEFGTGDRLILSLGTPLTTNVDYTLQISFSGKIQNSLTGFYKCSYTENNDVRYLAVTQFEPTSARSAFPCFDEPEFKAKFEISIAHRDNLTALSNMKVALKEPIDSEPGWQWSHFDRSVTMSTYLVAYILTDFEHLETSYLSKDNITKPIRIWARPSFLSKANYALNITPRLLAYYEDVFGLPYALDKIDLIAIPEFSSGAMENWGLITFRETTLLFDDKDGTPREKQSVAIDVAHELAHQWFGNLVTMKWWTDLWLNEGFATYIENVGVDYIDPSWNMLESFTREKMELFATDALRSTAAVSREVTAHIAQKFDEISYAKAASLIRMLNHTITEKLFGEGLVGYLNKWKYRNAEENDLWDAMSVATRGDSRFKDLSIVDLMNTWTRQPGYPVVNVYRNYTTGLVTFLQKRFISDKTYKDSAKSKQLWHIPISYTPIGAPTNNWTTSPKIWLKERVISANLNLNQSEALYVNVDAIGYYRVNYDQKNWDLLRSSLRTGTVKPITKAQLIDDAFNLAKAGLLDYSYALGLTSCVINGEDSKTVWDLLLNNMGFLKHNLRATSGFIYFQDYMRIILKKQLEKLNYGRNQPKDDNESFLAENLLMWECLVEAPRCLHWAREEFNKLSNGSDAEIPSYLRSLIYNMAVKHGGREEFERLWQMFLNTSEPTLKSMIISNLPCVREESLITLLLEKSLSDIPNQYAVQVWSVEPPLGTRVAQDFLINNFQRVYDRFTGLDSFLFQAVLNGAFGFITSDDELERFKKFALEHKEQLMPMSQTLQKIVDTAALRISWIKEHAVSINAWFEDFVKDYKDDIKTSTTSTTEVITEATTSTTTSR